MPDIPFWKIRIDFNTIEQIIGKVHEFFQAKEKKSIQIAGINPETVVKSIQNKALQTALNLCEIVIIDNTLIFLTLKLFGYHPPSRVPSPDLMAHLLVYANKNSKSIFLFGAEPDVVKKAADNIREKFPNISEIHYRHGFFKRDEEEEILDSIIKCNPDFVFIGLPTPLKECLGEKFKGHLSQSVLFGIGGAIDVYAGKVKRAHPFFRAIGLEGFLRIFQNPFDYGKRLLEYYPEFLFITFKKDK